MISVKRELICHILFLELLTFLFRVKELLVRTADLIFTTADLVFIIAGLVFRTANLIMYSGMPFLQGRKLFGFHFREILLKLGSQREKNLFPR